jgi:hypothetical protein
MTLTLRAVDRADLRKRIHDAGAPALSSAYVMSIEAEAAASLDDEAKEARAALEQAQRQTVRRQAKIKSNRRRR